MDKKKNKEVVLKAGDVIETDHGEQIELDSATAESLNEQINEAEPENLQGNLVKATSKKNGKKKVPTNGTFRFINKFKK